MAAADQAMFNHTLKLSDKKNARCCFLQAKVHLLKIYHSLPGTAVCAEVSSGEIRTAAAGKGLLFQDRVGQSCLFFTSACCDAPATPIRPVGRCCHSKCGIMVVAEKPSWSWTISFLENMSLVGERNRELPRPEIPYSASSNFQPVHGDAAVMGKAI